MEINNYFLVRQLVCILFLLDLISYTPYFNIFYGKGYNKGFLTNKALLSIIYLLWFSSILFLFFGKYTLISSFALTVLFRHYFINGRWKSLYRGGGAPGFMSHYAAMFIFLFELAFFLDKTHELSNLIHLMFKVDFGLILLCAGTYKTLAGYLKSEGMDYGTVNPIWGYQHSFFKNLNPHNIFFKMQNYLACIGEIMIGILLLIPNTLYQSVGAILCILSFVYLLPLIRLGRLAFLMMVLPLLYLPNLNLALLNQGLNTYTFSTPEQFIFLAKALVIAYIALLPIIKIMQYVNLFLNINFPKPIQYALTKYANFIPIIMWRVFTADVTNFFIRIYEVNEKTKKEKEILHENNIYSYSNWNDLHLKIRFLNVTESITITSIFTTLRYFKSKRQLFEEKLIQYAKTLASNTNSTIFKFQYISIQKGKERFEYVPVCNFLVDTQKKQITEEQLSKKINWAEKSKFSPIRESVSHGSYERLS